MGLIKKTAAMLGTALTAATAGVAIKNALEVKTDEEVGHKQGFYEKYVKRPQDFFFASLAAGALSPVLGTIAVMVKSHLGSPVLFQQERPGLKEHIFKLTKFKSMLDPQTLDGRIITDEERTQLIVDGVEVLSDEERLTSFGKKLRASSLDELPELWNIIKGDMSFVGPRPLSTAYLEYYNDVEKQRHDVRPGLTGAAQINGRNAASWDERFKYDVDYANSVSFVGDLRILLKTIGVVFAKEGIGQGEEIPESFNEVRKREWEERSKRDEY